MKTIMTNLILVCICIFIHSCNTAATQPLEIKVPEGLTLVTKSQKKFIEKVKSLTRNMSVFGVRQYLGNPIGESSKHLNYLLDENKIEESLILSK